MSAVDRWLLLALRGDDGTPIGPGWLVVAMTDLTALGGHTVIAIVVAGAAGYLVARRQPHVALLLAATVAGGMVASAGLKALIGRARPDVVERLAAVHDASFPSGHAMLSAVAYLTLAAMLARAEADRAERAYLLAAGVVLTALVGVSRVYLGVHWPSDVAAGWAFGAAWAWGCWRLAQRLQRAGEVEAPSD